MVDNPKKIFPTFELVFWRFIKAAQMPDESPEKWVNNGHWKSRILIIDLKMTKVTNLTLPRWSGEVWFANNHCLYLCYDCQSHPPTAVPTQAIPFVCGSVGKLRWQQSQWAIRFLQITVGQVVPCPGALFAEYILRIISKSNSPNLKNKRFG